MLHGLILCNRQVCNHMVMHAKMAQKMLRERKEDFDTVISDMHMLNMDRFMLLEIGLEMDLPVINKLSAPPKVLFF